MRVESFGAGGARATPKNAPSGLFGSLPGLSGRCRRILLRFRGREYHLTSAGYRAGNLLVKPASVKYLFDAGLVVLLPKPGRIAVCLTTDGLVVASLLRHTQPKYGQLDFGF